MTNNQIILTFIGGDARQIEAINMAAKEGFIVKAVGFQDIPNDRVKIYKGLEDECFICHALILPIPYKNRYGYINIQSDPQSITLEQVMKKVDQSTIIILGKADHDIKQQAEEKNIRFFDILEEESFAILNAIPTAEGAIQRAMEKTDITLHGANVLVLGYGRIGKCLARMLKGIGARVTVEARKPEDLAWIYENGYNGVHLDDMDSVLGSQQVIFNTIPHLVLTRERLKKVAKEAVIIDLASAPGGTDFEAAKEFGIRAYLELSLPGIVAPKTAGRIVYCVIKELIERAQKLGMIRGLKA
ncbi:dipicolinate synthase subunit DpsA [Caldicoprobacter algeriensis]|uniref:dipicolinate synthase subunit DpsA n=1 Tax=Caldicoprobacter algeriensis TaxID=699281 RepID=UPI0020791FF0|nr:dipicolinate synthase subunit DpsA [Caldicoprobacter algeriensis]MCM8900793.1 dipicolinate synthase subunit DpsA [Caldicoprobacter algeriensis]